MHCVPVACVNFSLGMAAGAINSNPMEARRPSMMSNEVDSVLKSLLPSDSGVASLISEEVDHVLEDALPNQRL